LKGFGIGVKENGEQAFSWSSQHQLSHPVMIDPKGEIYKNYANGSVPYHILIDLDFRITLSEEDFEKDRLMGFIQAALGKHEPK